LKKKATDNFTLVSWYKDAFADLGIGEKGKRNLPPPPENLFKLDKERSGSRSINGTNLATCRMGKIPLPPHSKGIGARPST
jgi:hypothetical protein